MKNFILTPVTVVPSQLENNYKILLDYVRENFKELIVGAKRRKKVSSLVTIIDNESIIVINDKKYAGSLSISKFCFLHNGKNIDCEHRLHDVYLELIILKAFAEDSEGSKYNYTIEKPRIKEQEDIYFLED